MKYLSITVLLILLPVSLFPEKEIMSDFDNTAQLLYHENESIPLGFEINRPDFISVRLESLSGINLYSANLGIKKAGYSTFSLPLLHNQYSGFYRVKFIARNNIFVNRIIYLPGLSTEELPVN